jgi:hypothetical protein
LAPLRHFRLRSRPEFRKHCGSKRVRNLKQISELERRFLSWEFLAAVVVEATHVDRRLTARCAIARDCPTAVRNPRSANPGRDNCRHAYLAGVDQKNEGPAEVCGCGRSSGGFFCEYNHTIPLIEVNMHPHCCCKVILCIIEISGEEIVK